MAPMSFYDFKTPVYQWLQLNKIYMTKTIFKSSKENVVCIGHLTNINPQRIDRTQYQDQINELLDAIADKNMRKIQRSTKCTRQRASLQNIMYISTQATLL